MNECLAGKYGPEKTPYLDTFHAVRSLYKSSRPLVFCRTDFLKRLGVPSPTLLKKWRLAQDVYLRALQSFQNQSLIGVFI